MSDRSWQDAIAADRMRVDREFADRVRDSPFSQQEWNVIMTAVEFRIEGEDDAARLVADTEKIEHVLPELENVDRPAATGGDSGGILDSVKDALGLGGVDQERLDAATELAESYATDLQAHLEEEGRWIDVREMAAQPSPE